MKLKTRYLLIFITLSIFSCKSTNPKDSIEEVKCDLWWKCEPIRLFQTNLRESDANLDVDSLVGELKKFNANTLIFNTGGVMAFYPTKLKFHYEAPGLRRDLLGELIDKCHQSGIRVIARFDFSRVHRSIAELNPQWLYISPAGKNIDNHGMIVTCPSGEYQQSLSMNILEEVLQNYPIDGVFFNMFGFKGFDVYANKYHGLCQCNACKENFQEQSNMSLPKSEDNSPEFEEYLSYRWDMTLNMLANIYQRVKEKDNNIAICNYYRNENVDIYFHETAHSVNDHPPYNQYNSSQNIKAYLGPERKPMINAVMNSKGIGSRFSGISEYQLGAELYQSIAEGSSPAFVINGIPQNYPDTSNFEIVRDIFGFHQRNEDLLSQTQSIAKIALIKEESSPEYWGIYKILKETHFLFDVIHTSEIADFDLSRYNTIIVPDIAYFDEKNLAKLDAFSQNGHRLIATHASFTSQKNEWFLKKHFGIYPVEADTIALPGYLEIDNPDIFKSFEGTSWTFLHGKMIPYTGIESVKKHLPYLTQGKAGPPEKVGGSIKTPFNVIYYNEMNSHIYISIPAGELYLANGNNEYQLILKDMLEHYEHQSKIFTTNAPPVIEINVRKKKSDLAIHFLNHSGFNGSTFGVPYPVGPFNMKIYCPESPSSIFDLNSGKKMDFKFESDSLAMEIKLDKLFKTIHLQF